MPTDTVQTDTLGKLLKFELEGEHSREDVTVLAAQNLAMGAVLGKVTAGAVPTTGTADGGNTGNGTVTSVTGGKNTKVGVYTVTCIQLVTNGGVFEVTGVNDEHLGTVAIDPGAGGTGVFTSDEVNLTLTDAGTDFVFGDKFTITVAAGGGQVRAFNVSGVDGSGIAYGLGLAAYDASASGDRTVSYTGGGDPYEIMPNDVITGATSGATARVISITLATGTFAGGDAAGVITVDGQVGTFESENLNVGTNLNVATIGANTAAVAAADMAGVAIVRDAQIVESAIVWPSGLTSAQKATARTELADKGIIVKTEG